jgi:hypothetical protein
MQYDYRQVYANILADWMGVAEDSINNDVFFGNFIDGPKEEGGFYEKLPIAGDGVTGFETFVADKYFIESLYPNPAFEQTVLSFHINHTLPVNLKIMDLKGRILKEIIRKKVQPGMHKLKIDVHDLNSGIYVCEFKAGIYKETRKLLISR